MKRILFITKHNPFGVGGGDFATHAYLRAFCEISNGEIDVCIANHCEVKDSNLLIKTLHRVNPRCFCKKIISVFTGEMHRFTSYVKKIIKKNYKEYGLCVFDHSSIAGTLVEFVNKYEIKTVTIHHNFEREYFQSNAHFWFEKVLFLNWVIKNERKAYKNSCYNFFLTKEDLLLFERKYGITTATNNIIGCFEYMDFQEKGFKKKEIKSFLTFGITGSLASKQTSDSIIYFFNKLYPSLPKTSKVIIAGRTPRKVIIDLCYQYENVELIKNPDNMQQVMDKIDIYICPVNVGGGIKLRVMDGLKNGLPIVAHTVSARGYSEFENCGFMYSFFTTDEFNNAIINISHKIENNELCKNEIISKYKELFSFKSGLRRIQNIIPLF